MKKILLVLIILIAAFWLFRHLPSKNGSATISDFLACQKAGRPIIDSYPRVCQGADGKDYTEIVDEQELNTDPVILSPDLSRPVTSPLNINGEARGFWFFERQFNVSLIDDKGRIVATGTARTKSSALTVDFIPFAVTLSFKTPTAKAGTIILDKANPSGLASQVRSVQLPILFQAPDISNTTNNPKSKIPTGNSTSSSNTSTSSAASSTSH